MWRKQGWEYGQGRDMPGTEFRYGVWGNSVSDVMRMRRVGLELDWGSGVDMVLRL